MHERSESRSRPSPRDQRTAEVRYFGLNACLALGKKVVDLSADFRLADPAAYARWYGHEHHALDLQQEAVYGLVEIYRAQIAKARLVANPGCYTTCAQLALVPLLRAGAIETGDIIVDAKSGMTGAGRAAKEGMLFSEVSEGFHAYGVGHHRHMAELDQEFTRAAGREVIVTFTPHLVPLNRGILATCYARPRGAVSAERCGEAARALYAHEPFVRVREVEKNGRSAHTGWATGTNFCFVSYAVNPRTGHVVACGAIDNLGKGAAGQAIQNANLMCGLPEVSGLGGIAVHP